MYFTVKYIDINTFLKTKDLDVSGESPDRAKIAFSVKNKELLVNPDCFIGIILNYIFEEVGIKENMRGQFDLMTDKGKLLYVHNYPLDYCAINIFADRGLYFVAYCEDGEPKPLIAKNSKEYSNLAEHRKKAVKKTSRSSRGSIGHELPTGRTTSARSLKSGNSKS